MRLEKLAQDYIRYKQALGARFKTDAMHLGVFFELLNGRQSDITLEFSDNEFEWDAMRGLLDYYSDVRDGGDGKVLMLAETGRKLSRE